MTGYSRPPWWEWGIWAFRAVYTQANAGGGAVVVDFTPGAGDTMILMNLEAENSGTNTLQVQRTDEDNNRSGRFVQVSSAAGVFATVPRGTTIAGSSATMDSTLIETRLFRGDDLLTVLQTGAGVADDTLTITLRALLSSPVIPTRDLSRSTNSGDVTEATPTVNKVI